MRAYADILRAPNVARLFAAMVLARLPLGINGLALVLFVREQGGSFATAGATAGALALGSGLGAPVGGRLVDRLGARVLLALAAAHATGLVAIFALGSAGGPAAALVALSAVTGVAFPPTSSVLRAQYQRLFADTPTLLQGAFALDSVLTEVIFVAGPLLTAAMVAFVSPGAALLLSAGAVAAGALAFQAALPAAARDEGGRAGGAGRLGALRAPGILTLVLAMLPVGVGVGAIEVALPAFADEQGRPSAAGVLIAIWSVASAAGGLAYGARRRRASLVRIHLVAAVLVPIGFLPLALAGSPATMAALVIPGGFFLAPLIATRNELAGRVAPAGAETEAFTWPITALVSGISVGAAAAGGVIDASGWQTAVVGAAAVGAIGAGISFARRATLVSASA
ncbi:MAG TPA: MFS transporter [Solirubrobacteraceae bacterium]